MARTMRAAVVRERCADLDTVHQDHLHCERKAAQSALSLVRSYPQRTDLVVAVARLADRYALNIDTVHSHIGSGSDPEVWKRVTKMTLAIAERPMRGAAIDAWEWVDAEEAQAAEGGPEPFPLTYTGDDRRLRWTHDAAGLMLVITRPFAEVAILRERLWSAEQELLALNGAGVDGMSKMSAEWPTLAPLLNAHKAALLALESETLKQGQIVCGALLKADGTAEWHPATAAPPQRAEGRHWRLLMKLIHAAGYALPPIRFSLDLDRALDAMGRYEGLAAATREAGYKVPSLPSDELISWIAWGIKAGTNHSALEEFVSDTVVALGGQVPPPDVVRLWVITSGASLQEIAAELRAQQLHDSGKLTTPVLVKTMRASAPQFTPDQRLHMTTGEPPESRGGVRGDADADSLFGGQE